MKEEEDILEKIERNELPLHGIERMLGAGAEYRAVNIRRKALLSRHPEIEKIPWMGLDYTGIYNRCCENVIGYMPVPLGIITNCLIDGAMYSIPMATTEGALVASTQRGFKAISVRGARTLLHDDGMTRGPIISFSDIYEAGRLKIWLGDVSNFMKCKEKFDSTSRFASLISINTMLSGSDVYLRFKATTGDAMGMNMLSKGCQAVLDMIKSVEFPEMKIVSLSGNICCDKKPAAINWIEGRGKSVISTAKIDAWAVLEVLKVTCLRDLVDANIKKNLKGSAMAGSASGGFNAHAANIVTAIFIATGQDPAQSVVSSNCITELELEENDSVLKISCTMPSIEVGTVGGGTCLEAQKAALGILGVAGPSLAPLPAGANAQMLARIVCSAVMAGELSLLASLVQGTLVDSHSALNRGNK